MTGSDGLGRALIWLGELVAPGLCGGDGLAGCRGLDRPVLSGLDGATIAVPLVLLGGGGRAGLGFWKKERKKM